MNILFDQGVPVPLRRYLTGHSIDTAFERGWSQFNDRELLDAVQENQYELLMTTDQNLKHQQNLVERPLAILVLRTTAWPRIEPAVNQLAVLVERMKPGDYMEWSP